MSGQLIIETFQGMSFLQAVQFGRGTIPPLVMKQNMAYMNQCAPFRLRGIWIYHQSMVLSILMVGMVGGLTGLTEPQGCPACKYCDACQALRLRCLDGLQLSHVGVPVQGGWQCRCLQ